MGAELAVNARAHPEFLSSVSLRHFNDEIIAKLELESGDKSAWVLTGRVVIRNVDSDFQQATAKLVHDANVVLDEVGFYMPGGTSIECVTLQTGFVASGHETITLECNTYNGDAWAGSIIATKVDDVQFQ